MPPPVLITALDIITDALREIGVLAAIQTPSAADAALGFSRLNQLIGTWATQRLTIPGVQRKLYPLTANQGAYQLGPGVLPAAGWDDYRPHWIQAAGLVRPSGEPLEASLEVLTADRYAGIGTKSQGSAWPAAVYDDRAEPVATITVYPGPTVAGLLLALYVPVALERFPSLHQQVALGEGVQQALMSNLALRLTAPFQVERTPDMVLEASARLGDLKRLHLARTELLTIDAAFCNHPGGGYDIYSDTVRGGRD